MASSHKWMGDKYGAKVHWEFRRRIEASAIALANKAKTLLSVEGTGRAIRPMSYYYGGRKRNVRKKGLVYGHAPSLPGEPPRKQFGRLKGSIAWEFPKVLTARVGTNVKYGRWLELGTGRMKARPWLRRSLREMLPRIRILMNRPLKIP